MPLGRERVKMRRKIGKWIRSKRESKSQTASGFSVHGIPLLLWHPALHPLPNPSRSPNLILLALAVPRGQARQSGEHAFGEEKGSGVVAHVRDRKRLPTT